MRWTVEFEGKHQRLASWANFVARIMRNIVLAAFIILLALLIGMAGYAGFEGLAPIDAFLNAAMILSGMGPVAVMTTHAGKIFAGLYALFSGIVIVATTGLILAPVLHRVIHHFHCDDDDNPHG